MARFIFISLLIFSVLNSYTQVHIPYFENFESENFWRDPNLRLDIASPLFPNGQSCPEVCEEELMGDGQGYSWEISTEHSISNKNLKLTVHEEDHSAKATYPRSRSEFVVKAQAEKSETFYYSWKFFVPNDEEFTDPDGGWHIMAQIWETNKILTIEYLPRENKMYLLLFSPNRLVHSRIHVNNSITRGEWIDLTLKIHWSNSDRELNDSDYGYLSMWVNGKPVVAESSDERSDESMRYISSLSDNYEEEPSEFDFNNIHFYEEKNGLSRHNLKFGHYRSYQYATNSLYFDDLQITRTFPNNSFWGPQGNSQGNNQGNGQGNNQGNIQETVFPNPFEDVLHLNFPNSIIEATLYDPSTNCILYTSTFEESTSINLPDLPSGDYILNTINFSNNNLEQTHHVRKN